MQGIEKARWSWRVRVSLAVLTILALLGASGYCTETRKATLVADDNVLLDTTNPFVYPSTIVNYRGTVVADGLADNGFAYGYVRLGRGVLGVSVGRTHDELMAIARIFRQYYDLMRRHRLPVPAVPKVGLELLYGVRVLGITLGGRLAVGQHVRKANREIYAIKAVEKATCLDVGLSASLSKKASLDFAVQFSTFDAGFSYREVGTSDYSLDGQDARARTFKLRMRYRVNERCVLIPYGRFRREEVPGVTLTENNANGPNLLYQGYQNLDELTFGLGASLKPRDKTTMLFSLRFHRDYRISRGDMPSRAPTVEDPWVWYDTETNEEGNYVFPALSTGVEVELRKWLVARFGASYVARNTWESISPSTEDELWVAEYAAKVGVGFCFGSLRVDLELNRQDVTRLLRASLVYKL